jgi:hypothetical protein
VLAKVCTSLRLVPLEVTNPDRRHATSVPRRLRRPRGWHRLDTLWSRQVAGLAGVAPRRQIARGRRVQNPRSRSARAAYESERARLALRVAQLHRLLDESR